MEIKIDTKRDSIEDIKHTIEFLQRMVEKSTPEMETNPEVESGSFNMFGNMDENTTTDDKDKDDTPSVSIVEY